MGGLALARLRKQAKVMAWQSESKELKQSVERASQKTGCCKERV